MAAAPALSQDQLSHSLETQFGLRNARSDWIRRQTAFSADELTDTINRTDICTISSGTLPWNVHQAHRIPLGVKVFVQIEDIINIAKADPRSNDRPRVMQMALNDGVTDFVAVELQPWGNRISLAVVPGRKIILLETARVFRGRVLLRDIDFKMLPPGGGNVWGAAHGELVAEARSAAGIADPNARTLESVLEGEGAQDAELVWTGDSADALPLNIGGIAHPALLSNDGDDGSNDVAGPWTGPTPATPTYTPAPAPAPTPITAPITAPASTPATAPVPIPMPPSSRPLPPPQQLQPQDNTIEQAVNVIDVDIPDVPDVPDVPDIPDIPDCDSDPDEPQVPEAITSHMLSQQDGDDDWTDWTDILQVPQLPIIRLADIESTMAGNGGQVMYCRMYSTKSEPKLNIAEENGQWCITITAPIDDGTMVRMARLDASFASRLTQGSTTDAQQLERDSELVGSRIRNAVRNLCGFATLTWDDQGELVITDVSPTPPGDQTEFLKSFADNVEARFAKMMVGE